MYARRPDCLVSMTYIRVRLEACVRQGPCVEVLPWTLIVVHISMYYYSDANNAMDHSPFR